MPTREVDVAVQYTLRTVDKGVRQAVSLSQDLTRATKTGQKELDAALRANSVAWKDTARVASSAQRQVSEAALKSSSQVDKALLREIEGLRKAHVGYKEIASASRGWGASAQETAAAVKRAADEEIRQIDRVVAARNKLRGMVGLSAKDHAAGGRSGMGVEERGIERGVIRAGAGRFRSGVSFLGGGLVGGLAGYASVEGAKQAVDFTKELALNTRTLSAVTGMDSKTASEWIAVTEARGIKTRSFATSLKSLSTQTEGALHGTKASVTLFKELGITQDELKKHSGDLSSMLGLVADHLDKMPGGAEKTAIASKLLGRNYTALMPMLLEGSKGMADQRKQAAALGVTLGGNAAENAKKLEEASINLKIAQEGLQVQFAEHVAPAIMKVTEGGIKLFGVLRKDLGPAVHFVTSEVKDAAHWLGEHKTVLHALEGTLAAVAAGYVGLKVISGTVRLVRGVTSDIKTAGSAMKGLASPISSIKGLFAGQETESQALARSQNALADANTRLAASFDEVAVASKGAAGGEALAGGAGEAGALAGGAPMLPVGRGAGAMAAAGDAAKVETVAAQEVQQTGMMGLLLGRQGQQSLVSKLGSGALKGAGVGFAGMLGAQLIGGAIGGKTGRTVTGIGTGASIGAGAGMILGVPGALAGAGIGAATVGLKDLFGGQSMSDATKKLQSEMVDAAKRNDFKRLQQLASDADKAGGQLRQIGQSSGASQLRKLSAAASKTAGAIQAQTAGRRVSGIEAAVSGSKYGATVNQIEAATISKLGSVGPAAQRAGGDAIVKFTAGLESKKRLPVGSTDRLIRQLEAYYGPSFASSLTKYGDQSMAAVQNSISRSKVVSKVQDQVDQMHKAWGLLVPDVKVTSSNIEQVMTSNIETMRQKVLSTSGQQQKDAINHLNTLLALYQQYSPLIATAGASAFTAMSSTVTSTLSALSKTIGGDLGGWVSLISQFAQAATPALSTIAGAVQGGALSTPAGGKQVGDALGGLLKGLGIGKHDGGYFHGAVPGDQTRDGTLAWLSGREFVMTGHGQAMMDYHAPGLLDHIAASQAPHFAGGGPVSFQGRVSTFGPPTEGAGTTATGVSDSVAGISLRLPGTIYQDARNEALKNRWFELQIGSHRDVAKDIDIGPNQSTGRNIDVTGAQAKKMGINPFAFPTDSIGRVVELIGGQHGHPASSNSTKLSFRPNAKTTFKPSGPGLHDGFFQGYEYGSGAGSGLSPTDALHAAILGSQLTSVTSAVPSAVKFSLPSIGQIPQGLQGKAKLAALDRSMTGVARHLLGRPYIASGSASGGRPPSLNAQGYDCSSAVSTVINLGGRGVLPPVASGWTTDQLKGWGVPGDGKYITVGVRGSSGSDAHTMMQFFGHYFESSHPGKGPHWDGGWSEDFPIRRHPPGLRRGGRVPYNDAGWWYKRRGLDNPTRGLGAAVSPRRFQAGGRLVSGYVPPGGGRYTPPTRGSVHQVFHYASAPAMPSWMTYQPPTTIGQVNAYQPITHYDYGTGRESSATRRLVTRDVGAISAAGSNQQAKSSLTAFARVIDSTRKMPYDALLKEARTLQAEIAKATRSGDKQQATRLRQALQLVEHQEGTRVGKLVKTATDEAAAIGDANKKLTNLMTRSQIDPASAQGTAMIAKFQDQSVRVIRDEVSKLQKAFELAKKAGNKRAMGDIGTKLHDALSALDDATATAVQDHVDAVNAAKQQVADLAQAGVDTATHGATMASTGEQGLQLQQQLAGTSGTAAGAKQLSDYVNQSVVPSMQKQVAALQEQQQVAQQQGNTTLAQQIGEQIGQTQNGIMQEQLTAQQAIQQATQATAQNTQALVGNLGVSYNGGNFGDLASMLNGA